MDVPEHIKPFWNAFAEQAGADVDDRFYEVFHFGDRPETALQRAELVIAGIKRAAAGLVWSFEAKGLRVPQPGDLSVVTNWEGQPLCVIETTRVDIVPFNEVTAEFAASEGEGGGSLEDWRQGHTKFYARALARIGRTVSPTMPIACEHFHVVYRHGA